LGWTDSKPKMPVGVERVLVPPDPVLGEGVLPVLPLGLEEVPVAGAEPDDGLVLPTGVGSGTGVGDEVGDDGGIS
jgi:hypothetical protein